MALAVIVWNFSFCGFASLNLNKTHFMHEYPEVLGVVLYAFNIGAPI